MKLSIHSFSLLAATLLSVAVSSNTARADVYSWINTGTAWSGTANWSHISGTTSGTFPGQNSDTAIFGTLSIQPIVTANTLLGGVTLANTAGGLTLGTNGLAGTILKIYAGGFDASAQISGTSTVNVQLTTQNTNTFKVGTGGTLVFNGPIGGSVNTTTLGATGAEGTIILNGGDLGGTTNARSGNWVLQAGTIIANNDAAFGITGSDGIVAPRTVTFSGSSTASLSSTGTHNLANSIVLTGSGRVGSTGQLTLSGVVSSTRSFTKTDSGTVIMTGTNTYTGGTVVEAGTLQLGNGGTSGSISGTAAISLGASSANVLSFNRSDAVSYSGTISGSGQITHIGSGTTTLSARNSYSGGTTITAGTLLLTGTSAAGAGFVHVDSAGTLRVNTGVNAGIANTVSLRSASAGYILDRATGQGFNAYAASSSLGGTNVTASLLAGTASAARTLTTSMAATSAATNDNVRMSDVFNLQGTSTDVFVLQLQIADVVNGEFLGWVNGSNTWVNAVAGNSTTGGSAITNYAGSFAASGAAATASYLGSWGYDTTNETVWAVLDHNSEFAVITIPEPQTWVLIGFGIATVGWRLKTRRSNRA